MPYPDLSYFYEVKPWAGFKEVHSYKRGKDILSYPKRLVFALFVNYIHLGIV
jgi:hypothetical protein